MPSVAVARERQSITVATALGVLTVTSTANLYPGTNAWVSTNNGATTARVKILEIVSSTTLRVRKWPLKMEADGSTHGQENFGAPGYGRSDMTAFNGTSFISMEAQAAPIDPSFSKRIIP